RRYCALDRLHAFEQLEAIRGRGVRLLRTRLRLLYDLDRHASSNFRSLGVDVGSYPFGSAYVILAFVLFLRFHALLLPSTRAGTTDFASIIFPSPQRVVPRPWRKDGSNWLKMTRGSRDREASVESREGHVALVYVLLFWDDVQRRLSSPSPAIARTTFR